MRVMGEDWGGKRELNLSLVVLLATTATLGGGPELCVTGSLRPGKVRVNEYNEENTPPIKICNKNESQLYKDPGYNTHGKLVAGGGEGK